MRESDLDLDDREPGRSVWRGGVARTVVLSGAFNLVLVLVFVAGTQWSRVEALLSQGIGGQRTAIARASDPLAAARLFRRDNELTTRGVQSHLKGALTLSTVRLSDDSGGSDADLPGTLGVEGGRFGEFGPEASLSSASYEGMPTAEETAGMRIAPILRKDARTGQIEIGNFKSMTFVGDASECLDMGYAMLGDTGTSNDLLEIMTTSDAITIARICARNGSVIISCRNDQITVSPRQARPDDKCKAPG